MNSSSRTRAAKRVRLAGPDVAEAFGEDCFSCGWQDCRGGVLCRSAGVSAVSAEVSALIGPPPVPTGLTAKAGNQQVSPANAEARRREIFQPYHDRISAELDDRIALGRPTILVAVHSFTPVFHGESRPWHVGVLYNRDARMARILLELFRSESGIVVGDNQPYAVSDESDYTIPIHGERRSIPHVELEIRQDLLAEESGQAAWAGLLARALVTAEGIIVQPR